MEDELKTFFLKLGFSEEDSGNLVTSTILLSIQNTFEETLTIDELNSLEEDLKAENYKELKEYYKKVDKVQFEKEFAKNLEENIKNVLERVYNEAPNEIKEGLPEILNEIKAKDLADSIKHTEGGVEDVLKNISN